MPGLSVRDTGLGTYWRIKIMPKLSKLLLAAAAVAVVGLSGCATTPTEVTQSWHYNQLVIAGPYDAGGGTVSKNTLTLQRATPTSTTGRLRFTGSITDRCMDGWQDTAIENTPTAIVLLPKNNFATCTDFRITIRNDGTGGTVERRAYKSATWNPYAIEPGLTPK